MDASRTAVKWAKLLLVLAGMLSAALITKPFDHWGIPSSERAPGGNPETTGNLAIGRVEKTPGLPTLLLSGMVKAQSLNALEAKQRIETQLEEIRSFAQGQGGHVTRGSSRYVRLKGEGGSARRDAGYFLIVQHIEIELPASVKRPEVELQLVRAGFAQARANADCCADQP